MTTHTATERLAHNYHHPKIKASSWSVYLGQACVYGPANYALCAWFKKQQGNSKLIIRGNYK